MARSYEEDRLQISCVYWFGLQYPKLTPLLHHSPNEGYLRDPKKDGAKRKAMGVRAGFPDLILCVPKGRFCSLAIEMKTEQGKQSEAQKQWQKSFEEVGGVYVICRSFERFQEIINRYLAQAG